MVAALLCALALMVGTVAPAHAYTGAVLYEPNATTNANDLDSYEAAIRLQYSGATNGTIIASFERNAGNSTNPPPGWLIDRSTDNGNTFTQISFVAPAVHPSWTYTVQPDFLELAQPSGSWPAGTLLLAVDLVPGDLSQSELQVYRSSDQGNTWSYVSDIATGGSGPSHSGVWEPFLVQLSNGSIVAYYSDETHSGYSQLIGHKISTDGGSSWGSETYDWASTTSTDRPGMATVAKMGNGHYIMSVEMCGAPGDYCQVHVKTSSDGLVWGSGPSDMGTRTVATSGHGLHGNPYITWSPAGGPNGEVILNGQNVVESLTNGNNAGNWGQTLFVNTNDGSGLWSELTSPIPFIPGGYQSGYRSAILPSPSGTSLLYLTASYTGSGQRNRIVYGNANSGVLPYNAPFAGGTDVGWQTFGGAWSVSGGVYSDSTAGRGEKSMAGSTGWTDYTMQGDVRLNAAGNAGLLIRVTDPSVGVDSHNGYYAGISSTNGGVFLGREQYNWTLLGSVHAIPGGVSVGSWYHLTVRAVGCTFAVSAQRVGSTTAPTTFTYTDSGCVLTYGQVGVRMDSTPSSWRNITVTATGGSTTTPTPYLAPFATGSASGWSTYGGTWSDSASAETYSDSAGGAGDKAVVAAVNGADYTLQGNVRLDTAGTSDANAGLVLRVSNPSVGVDALTGYYVGINRQDGTVFVGKENYNWTLLQKGSVIPGGGVVLGAWYHLIVRVAGCTLTVSAQRAGVAEQSAFTYTDSGCTITSGAIGVRTFNAAADWQQVTVTTG